MNECVQKDITTSKKIKCKEKLNYLINTTVKELTPPALSTSSLINNKQNDWYMLAYLERRSQKKSEF